MHDSQIVLTVHMVIKFNLLERMTIKFTSVHDFAQGGIFASIFVCLSVNFNDWPNISCLLSRH